MPNYWFIWYEVYEDDKKILYDRYPTAYKYKHNAERRAKQMWGKDLYNPLTKSTYKRKWIVSQTNPWPDRVYDT